MLSPARVFALPAAPELLGAGDFNADGHLDIVTGARGSQTLVLLPGDGRGGFAKAQAIALPGKLTALLSGEINQADGLADVVVGVIGKDGPRVLVFESPDGALKAPPESLALPAVATALALGRLDDDALFDLAVAAERELVIVKGRDRRLSLDPARQAEVAPARLSQRAFTSAIKAVAIGDFASPARLALGLADGTVQLLGRAPDAPDAAFKFEIMQAPTGEPLSIAPDSLLVSARLSTQAGQDLVIADAARLRLVAGGLEVSTVMAERGGAPVAVLPLQLNGDARNDLVILRRGQSAPQLALSAPTAIFTVTNTNDSGAGSLRDAINQANATAGADTINFAIGSDLQTINLLSALPTLSETVTIDGTTQPGFAGAPLIELRGTSAGANARGLQIINVANCLIKGLVVNSFAKTGVFISGAAASGNQVQGCYIGTNAAGTAAIPNGTNPTTFDSDGLDLVFGAHDNLIGGTTADARNLISGNFGGGGGDGVFIAFPGTNNNLVQGNYLGTNAAGTAAIANGFGGVEIATDTAPGPQGNIIGGTTAGAGNVASGNGQVGVGIFNADSNNNLVQGNFLGTNAAGTGAVPNGVAGAEVGNPPGGGVSAKSNLIGGTTPAARNIISGNSGPGGDGVFIRDFGTVNNLVQGNYVGLNAAGTAAVPNSFRGVEVAFGAQGNTIGGTVAGARNILSGNSESGVAMFNPGTNGNIVQGNYVGLTAAGTAPIRGEAPQPGSSQPATGTGVLHANKFGGATSPYSLNTLAQVNALNMATASALAAISNNYGVAIASSAQNNVIGGTAAGARNVISGNNIDGVFIVNSGTNGNTVQGNFIGTNPAGTAAMPNGTGIEVSGGAQNNTIGGTTAGAGNVVSGNGGAVTFPNGILMGNVGTSNNRVQGNLIGTQADGVSPLGNTASHGIAYVVSIGSGNSITDGNVIAFSGGAGVFADSGVANSIRGNSIFSNNGLGIDLAPFGVNANDNCDGDFGANNLQNFPVLTAATSTASNTTLQGTLNSVANTSFTLEFFANPACDASGNGEGKTFIGALPVTTNAGCTASFNFTFPSAVPVGQFVTATATDPAGNTSEFSACLAVVPGCLFTIAPTSQSFGAAGGAGSVNVTADSGCAWTAISNAPWLMINSGASGSGNGTVSYAVAANMTPLQRTGTLTIAGQTFTVMQAEGCSVTINPTSQSFTASGGSGSVTVTASTADCMWLATSNAPWIILSGPGGTGSGSFGFTVQANTSPARTGTFTIAGNTFTVMQADGCVFAINPTSQSFAAAGGTGSVNVTAGAGCAWTAVSNAGFITITSGGGGSGNGTVNYSVAANVSPARSGTLTIAGQTFTVNQASGCVFTLSATSQHFPGAGGAGMVNVASGAGCAWTAVSNDAFITVTAGAAGNGNGTVGSMVAANAGLGGRSGTLTIAGQTFTVTQSPQRTAKADFDGDGKTDFSVWRGNLFPSPWLTLLSGSNNSLQSIDWGTGQAPYFDVPVPGDYDGDGKTDQAIWRGGDTIWYIRPSATPGAPILKYFGANYAPYFDVPTPGDFDGDGKADIAVWRPTSGTWFAIRSTDNTFLIQGHGQNEDVPVPAYGVR
ncbi:MAG: hypothetical protein HYR56_06510 [Acidobacteria bacterium]|nr:hypothetical protein [Acidobacteriota bacterium]